MIRYTLRCDRDHEFEAWFRSSGDYDRAVAARATCAARSAARAGREGADGAGRRRRRRTSARRRRCTLAARRPAPAGAAARRCASSARRSSRTPTMSATTSPRRRARSTTTRSSRAASMARRPARKRRRSPTMASSSSRCRPSRRPELAMALVVITGANRGIGLALARGLHEARRRGDRGLPQILAGAERPGVEVIDGVEVSQRRRRRGLARRSAGQPSTCSINNAGIHRTDGFGHIGWTASASSSR